MRVVILGGYAPKQSVGAVYRAFERQGHTVTHVPTLPGIDDHARLLIDGADLLFMFKIGHNNIKPGFIRSLKEVTYKVFWNFDDPHWITQTKNPWLPLEFDLVLTSCHQSLTSYRGKGCKNVAFMPPAMDLQYYGQGRFEKDHLVDDFCTFIATTLYNHVSFPHQLLDRSKMIDRLTQAYGDDFKVWGYGREMMTKAACLGAVDWETSLPLKMQGSLININTHAVTNQRLYFNERFFQITATKRAQFVDRVRGFEDIFREDEFVFYSSLDELLDKIAYYKDRPAELQRIGEAGFDAMNNWTYDEAVQRLVDGLESGKLPELLPTFLV